jgi:hypothetical protein
MESVSGPMELDIELSDEECVALANFLTALRDERVTVLKRARLIVIVEMPLRKAKKCK